jgi:hypothetical protein
VDARRRRHLLLLLRRWEPGDGEAAIVIAFAAAFILARIAIAVDE